MPNVELQLFVRSSIQLGDMFAFCKGIHLLQYKSKLVHKLTICHVSAKQITKSAQFCTKFQTCLIMFNVCRAVAEYLNRDLPYKLSADDIYITLGCMEAVEIILTVITRLGAANILLPRPGWPFYESFAKRNHLEVRHFDLLPERGWEVDLEAVEALADENTAAIVIINPCNPCGNVLTYQHLQKV